MLQPLPPLTNRRGSGLVVWDSGTPAPPLAARPNDAGDDPNDVPVLRSKPLGPGPSRASFIIHLVCGCAVMR